MAKNEYANLMRSRLILIAGAIYLFFVLDELASIHPPGDPVYTSTLSIISMAQVSVTDYYTSFLLRAITHILTFYGAFFGIVLGVFSVAMERYGNTLNNLTTKPLYRDTIINGKLIGSILFILTVFAITIALFAAFVMMTWGDSFTQLAGGFLIRLPVVTLLSLVYVLVFYLAALFISLLVKDLAFALILGITGRVMLDTLPSLASQTLSILQGGNQDNNLFSSWTPDGILHEIYQTPMQTDTILSPSMDFLKAVIAAMPVASVLIVYMIILVFASYTLFVRRDIT